MPTRRLPHKISRPVFAARTAKNEKPGFRPGFFYKMRIAFERRSSRERKRSGFAGKRRNSPVRQRGYAKGASLCRQGLFRRVEQLMGIEPTRPAWKAGVLPLNYSCTDTGKSLFIIADSRDTVKPDTPGLLSSMPRQNVLAGSRITNG